MGSSWSTATPLAIAAGGLFFALAIALAWVAWRWGVAEDRMELLQQQATELKLSITSEEIDRSIEQVKRENGWTDAQLSDLLAKMRPPQTMSAYRQQIKKQLLGFKVMNIAVGSKVAVSGRIGRTTTCPATARDEG